MTALNNILPSDVRMLKKRVHPSVLLVDLPAEPLLAAAPYLVERGWYVVPVVQRWIASPAVLPCRRLVERLVFGAWQVRRPTSPRGAALIANHGMVAVAPTPAKALHITGLVERSAQIVWGARQLGEIKALPPEVNKGFESIYGYLRQNPM